MIIECFATCEIILVIYLVIFRIRHYGKFSLTREIRSHRRSYHWNHV